MDCPRTGLPPTRLQPAVVVNGYLQDGVRPTTLGVAMTAPYDAARLNAARIEQWRDDDLALLEYMPKWRGGGGEATRLLLDFKEEVPQAQAEAIDRSLRAFNKCATSLRKLGLRYVVSIYTFGVKTPRLGKRRRWGQTAWSSHAVCRVAYCAVSHAGSLLNAVTGSSRALT